MLCHIQQVLPTKRPQPLHCGQEISLPPRCHCSIKSSSNAKADSCGVVLWLFSMLPSWRLTPDLLVKVTENTAIKDLVLILLFTSECWTRGKWAGWAQKHMGTDTLLDAVLTHLLWCPERLEKQENCKKFASQGYPWLLFLVSISTGTVQELAWTTPTVLQSNSMPIHFSSIFHIF